MRARGRIAAGSHGRDIHSAPTHVVEPMSRELGGDASPLEVGIHSDDLDHPDALVESVEGDGDEPDRTTPPDRDEGVRSSLVRPTRTSSACAAFESGFRRKKIGSPRTSRNEANRIPCASENSTTTSRSALMER